MELVPEQTARPRVLVVEDDESTAQAIAFGLQAAGMAPALAADGMAGRRALCAGAADLVVLDLMLPGVDGWDLIRHARRLAPRVPIIVLTARTNEHDRVEVLALGADDVMAKPFSMRELLARVRAALRREAVEGEAARRRPIHEGGLIIDPERMSVTVEGRPVELTPREFALISTLAAGKRAAMGRDEIFRRVWGGERAHGDRSVDVLVRRLRRRLEEAGAAQAYVQTLHGVGYRLAATPGGPQAESRSA